MSIQTIAKDLKLDKIPFVSSINRNFQDYLATNYNREVVIDICTVCKSNCVYCLHQRNKLAKPQVMDIGLYHELIEILVEEKFKKIHLFQSGEPFLHPDVYDMVWLGLNSHINVTVGTRLNAIINLEKLIEAVEFSDSVLEFLITIDTITRMNQISPNINKNLVINNIQELSKLLKYKNIKFTFVSVITKVNEDSMYEVRDFVNSYGFKTWYAGSMAYYMWKLANQSDLDRISKLITTKKKYQDRFNIVNGEFITKRIHCNAQIPTISPTGDVSICCHDMLHAINAGNILEVGSLNKIIKSDKYQNLKKLGLNKQLEICKSCN